MHNETVVEAKKREREREEEKENNQISWGEE
jgi:hypothetical protein